LLGLGPLMSLQAFMSSNSSTDGEGFMETARLIAGENPPRWLARHLQRWSSSVFLDGNVHAKQPGRAEATTRLKALSKATELADRELHADIVVNCLLAEEFGPLPEDAGLDATLREIGRRADVASTRLDLLGTGLDVRLETLSDGLKLIARELQDPELSAFLKAEQTGTAAPTQFGALLNEIKRQADAALLSPYLAIESRKTKAGRGRAVPPMASTPRSLCAAVILEAWACFHDGEYPRGSNHTRLWAAAEEYWSACGGETKEGWLSGRPSAWRPYFQEASEPPLENIRIEIRRTMKLSSVHNG
jgi:hypothetical protein